MQDLDRADRYQNIVLKRSYARSLLFLLAAQVAAANVVFVIYAWVGQDWRVPENVMIGWLGATVVELIGVVTVVTRHLFPSR
jgi:hypothetical protein